MFKRERFRQAHHNHPIMIFKKDVLRKYRLRIPRLIWSHDFPIIASPKYIEHTYRNHLKEAKL